MTLFSSCLLFTSDAGYFNYRSGNDKLAISASIVPSGSCSTVGQIDTLLQCFRECLGAFHTFYMFSRDLVTLSCLCRKDAPSTSLSGGEWNTYITPPCPQSYSEYPYRHLDICLRFVPDQQKYPMATSVCQQDGGDLINWILRESLKFFSSL